MWTKPLAEFLLVEPACSPLNAVAQHATDHLSGIDATHRTHVQEIVTGTEVGADQMIHPDEESGFFLCFPLRRVFGVFSPGHKATRKDHPSSGKFHHEIAILLLDNHGSTAKWRQLSAQEHIEGIEAEADTSFEQIIEQSTHR